MLRLSAGALFGVAGGCGAAAFDLLFDAGIAVDDGAAADSDDGAALGDGTAVESGDVSDFNDPVAGTAAESVRLSDFNGPDGERLELLAEPLGEMNGRPVL